MGLIVTYEAAGEPVLSPLQGTLGPCRGEGLLPVTWTCWLQGHQNPGCLSNQRFTESTQTFILTL